MWKNSFVALCALGLSTNLAIADDHTSSGSTWFALADFSTNLSTDVSPEDTSGIGNIYSGGITDDLDSSWALGLGYRYDNNIAAVLRYEEADVEVASQITFSNGSPIAVTSSSDTEITNVMLEAAYFIPYSESLEFFLLGGIGEAEIETSDIMMTVSGVVENLSCSDKNTETSLRVGIGATYYMSQTNGFYAGITRTDYGDVTIKDYNDPGVCSSASSKALDADLETDDFRIGYFMSF